MIIKKIKNQSGQTIIEVLISLSVVMIISVGFTNITLTALRNAQFARSQEQATKIAQEAMEIIRAIRDQNGTVESGLWEDLWDVSTSQCFNVTGTFPNYALDERNCADNFDESITPVDSAIAYRRKTVISRGTDEAGTPEVNTKQVVVSVFWADSRGTHQAEVNTLLTRWD